MAAPDSAPTDTDARLLFIQTTHQSYCPRIVYYHEHRGRLAAFPAEGFGTSAREVGPHRARAGPCLVLVEGVTASTEAVHAWWAGSVFERFCPRIFLLPTGAGDFASKEALVEALKQLEAPPGAVRLQCHPSALAEDLQEHLPLSWDLHHSRFEWVLSVLECEGHFRWGLERSAARHRQRQLDKLQAIGGEQALALSRAAGKLEEVFAVMGEPLGDLHTAVDLGAAPGGWTCVLAKRAQRVFAVDPAQLHPSVAALRNVVHLRQRAEGAVPQLRRELTAAADGGAAGNGAVNGAADAGMDAGVDSAVGADVGAGVGAGGGAGGAQRRPCLLACDMNLYFAAAMPIVQSLLPCLPSGTRVVFTCKLIGIGRKRGGLQSSLEGHRPPNLRIDEVLWLMANTMSERTVVATVI